MTTYEWPDPQALLDDLQKDFEERGQKLVMRSPDDLAAGFDSAKLFVEYEPGARPAKLAAVLFEGVSTRHALLDGNKWLAWQALTVFLALNELYLDAPEQAAFEIGMAVINKRQTVDDLADFIDAYVLPMQSAQGDEDMR